MQFNNYHIISLLLILANIVLTIFYSFLFVQLANFLYFAVFLVFVLYTFVKIRKGFNFVNIGMKKEISLMIYLNCLSILVLISNLFYIAIFKLLVELECVISKDKCQGILYVYLLVTVNYIYQCLVVYFIYIFINCTLNFTFLVKFIKIRRNLVE